MPRLPRYRSLVLPLLLTLAACGIPRTEPAPDAPTTTRTVRTAPSEVCFDRAGYPYRTDRCP